MGELGGVAEYHHPSPFSRAQVKKAPSPSILDWPWTQKEENKEGGWWIGFLKLRLRSDPYHFCSHFIGPKQCEIHRKVRFYHVRGYCSTRNSWWRTQETTACDLPPRSWMETCIRNWNAPLKCWVLFSSCLVKFFSNDLYSFHHLWMKRTM